MLESESLGLALIGDELGVHDERSLDAKDRIAARRERKVVSYRATSRWHTHTKTHDFK
jgi:hypothetical protein